MRGDLQSQLDPIDVALHPPGEQPVDASLSLRALPQYSVTRDAECIVDTYLAMNANTKPQTCWRTQWQRRRI